MEGKLFDCKSDTQQLSNHNLSDCDNDFDIDKVSVKYKLTGNNVPHTISDQSEFISSINMIQIVYILFILSSIGGVCHE